MKKIKLNEMPYIQYKGKDFDVEFENFKNVEDFIKFLHKALDGDKLEDKYGNVIILNNDNDKKIFLSALKNNWIFKSMFNGKFSKNEKILIEIIFNIYGV